MPRRSHVVFYSKVALLVIGVGIVIGIVLFSGNAATYYVPTAKGGKKRNESSLGTAK